MNVPTIWPYAESGANEIPVVHSPDWGYLIKHNKGSEFRMMNVGSEQQLAFVGHFFILKMFIAPGEKEL